MFDMSKHVKVVLIYLILNSNTLSSRGKPVKFLRVNALISVRANLLKSYIKKKPKKVSLWHSVNYYDCSLIMEY